MNLSGEAVGCLVAKYKLSEVNEKLIVISDDLALPFGNIRIRARGSAGGHNGLKSIIGALGTNEFIRLRIGIQPEHPISDSKRFVLDSFSRASRAAVEKVLERSAEALRAILRDGVLKAMTVYNSNE
jgi:PTH1 family peptidyl-tRNA hydrolase